MLILIRIDWKDDGFLKVCGANRVGDECLHFTGFGDKLLDIHVLQFQFFNFRFGRLFRFASCTAIITLFIRINFVLEKYRVTMLNNNGNISWWLLTYDVPDGSIMYISGPVCGSFDAKMQLTPNGRTAL